MKTKLALVAALVLATGSSALALDGYDGDNNRIPGLSVPFASLSDRDAPRAQYVPGLVIRDRNGAALRAPVSSRAQENAWMDRASRVH